MFPWLKKEKGKIKDQKPETKEILKKTQKTDKRTSGNQTQ